MADQFNTANSYIAQPSQVQPGETQFPAPYDLQAIGSEYATEFSTSETLLIQRAIQAEIFDAVPAKYKTLRLLFDKPVEYVNDDVFTYLEKTFGRTALRVDTGGGSAGGSPITLSLTSGGGSNITANKLVALPDNTKAMVRSVSGDDIVLVKLEGATDLPAVSDGDYISIVSSVIADGMNFLTHYDRMSKIERHNYVQLMHRDKRWTRKEITKFRNSGTTNYFALDKKEQMDLLLQDMFASFWNGERGRVEINIPGGTAGTDIYKASLMGGIFPLMVAAGCANSTGVTESTLQDVFETLAFQTDFKSEGGVRYIFGQNALLYSLSKVFKEAGVRYAPNDYIADLNLKEYRIGDMRFVPVATELFKELSLFPAEWKHRLIILDVDTIMPVCMRGYQPIEMGQTAPKGQFGSIEDYTEWWIQGMLSLKFNNPLSSFYIDTTGIVA